MKSPRGGDRLAEAGYPRAQQMDLDRGTGLGEYRVHRVVRRSCAWRCDVFEEAAPLIERVDTDLVKARRCWVFACRR